MLDFGKQDPLVYLDDEHSRIFSHPPYEVVVLLQEV